MTTTLDKANALAKTIEALLSSKDFGYTLVRVDTNLGISMAVNYSLGTKDEWTNGIFENDPLSAKICIHCWGDGTFTVAGLTNQSIYIDGQGYHKFGWRDLKKPCDAIKVTKHLAKYFTKVDDWCREYKASNQNLFHTLSKSV